jgi:putative membrane protein insertion efficiency factor
VLLAGVAAALLLGADLSAPPPRQLSVRVLSGGIRLYQGALHWIVPRGQCRFQPTCSSYAEQVLGTHGALRGGWLAARRLLRCGPWTEPGTLDPPPAADEAAVGGGKEIGGQQPAASRAPPQKRAAPKGGP